MLSMAMKDRGGRCHSHPSLFHHFVVGIINQREVLILTRSTFDFAIFAENFTAMCGTYISPLEELELVDSCCKYIGIVYQNVTVLFSSFNAQNVSLVSYQPWSVTHRQTEY